MDYIETATSQTPFEGTVGDRFLARAKEGLLTRDENPETHFCVYFAGYDPQTKKVFIGHHIKSGLWLFNGGHIDEGEVPMETLHREVGEEWGNGIQVDVEDKPALLTITEINNPTKQKCRLHYDIWYFIPLNSDTFEPDQELLAKEFHQTGWKSVEKARELIKNKNTLLALGQFEKMFTDFD